MPDYLPPNSWIVPSYSSPPVTDHRALPRLGAGLLLVWKAKEEARKLRRKAKRMSPGLERNATESAANWLEWASTHPVEAVDQLERLYDAVRHPVPPAQQEPWGYWQ